MGGWQDMYTERLVDSVVERVRDVIRPGALLAVIPTLVSGALEKGHERGSLCCVLKGSRRVEHEHINGAYKSANVHV